MNPEIHSVELKEAVLHSRLCQAQKIDIPFVIALNPGRVNLTADICSYSKISAKQSKVSIAKSNYKKLLRVYANRWRSKGVIVDLGISMGMPMGRQQVIMISSLPSFHAQNLEALFQMCIASEGVADLWSENFDPYIICASRANLFTTINEEMVI